MICQGSTLPWKVAYLRVYFDRHLNLCRPKTVLLYEIRADLAEVSVKLEQASPDLIEEAKSGNHRAFAEIYRIHVGRVYGICLRLLGDRSRAEEVTQQVFIRLWTKLASFRGESSFGSWLFRIALNVALSELKASASMQFQVSSLDDLPIKSVSQESCSQETRMDIENAIAALPMGARVIFVLHEIEGLNHKDIAEKLGLANGTCKAQLSRARKLLREALKRP
jgi:RNA polymerase sigma-70 factor (ECF subfamily)